LAVSRVGDETFKATGNIWDESECYDGLVGMTSLQCTKGSCELRGGVTALGAIGLTYVTGQEVCVLLLVHGVAHNNHLTACRICVDVEVDVTGGEVLACHVTSRGNNVKAVSGNGITGRTV